MLMGIADVTEDGIPSFVCDVAEKIFFPDLSCP